MLPREPFVVSVALSCHRVSVLSCVECCGGGLCLVSIAFRCQQFAPGLRFDCDCWKARSEWKLSLSDLKDNCLQLLNVMFLCYQHLRRGNHDSRVCEFSDEGMYWM